MLPPATAIGRDMGGTGARPSLQHNLKSDPFAVRDALGTARSAWAEWGLSNDVCDSAEQVLAEVLNNVVEHAHGDVTDGSIILVNRPIEDGLICEVRDNGIAMPDGVLPEGGLAAYPAGIEHLPEGGFGWFMIRAMTEKLEYRREAGWNSLRFKITNDSCG